MSAISKYLKINLYSRRLFRAMLVAQFLIVAVFVVLVKDEGCMRGESILRVSSPYHGMDAVVKTCKPLRSKEWGMIYTAPKGQDMPKYGAQGLDLEGAKLIGLEWLSKKEAAVTFEKGGKRYVLSIFGKYMMGDK